VNRIGAFLDACVGIRDAGHDAVGCKPDRIMVCVMGSVDPFGSFWVSDPDCGESRDRKMVLGEYSERVLIAVFRHS
jgi:hypothetical protein